MSAYVAVGVWHHWLVRNDEGFVQTFWPVVRRALDFVTRLQLDYGGIAWAQARGPEESPGDLDPQALLAASSSIYHAFRAGVALAELMDEPQPQWEIVGGRLGHALREHRGLFLDKSTYSMDWYYPVLSGPVRGDEALRLLESRWQTFVVEGLGVRCVDTNPWVTGAETCELAIALATVGDHERARVLLSDMQHLRHESGSYWTGSIYPDGLFWPNEQTTYTSAAVILAVDAVSLTTPGAHLFRGATLAPHFEEIALACGCATADSFASDVD
jgi:hypothetical protein